MNLLNNKKVAIIGAGPVYIRTDDIAGLYQSFLDKKISIYPNGQ